MRRKYWQYLRRYLTLTAGTRGDFERAVLFITVPALFRHFKIINVRYLALALYSRYLPGIQG